MIVYADHPRIEAALLDRDGNVLRKITLTENGILPVVAAANGRFLVAWPTDPVEGAGLILSADGDVLSTIAFPFQVDAACESAGAFAVLGTPARIATVARVSPDGRVTAQAEVNVPIDLRNPPFWYSMTSGSDGGLLIAYDDPNSSHALGFFTDFALHGDGIGYDCGPSGYDRLEHDVDGSHYVVLASPGGGLTATRVGIDKSPLSLGLSAGVVAKTAAGYFVAIASSLEPELRTDLASPPSATWHFTVVEEQFFPDISTDGHSIFACWLLADDVHEQALLSNGSVRAINGVVGGQSAFDGRQFVVVDACREGTQCTASPAWAQFASVDGKVTATVRLDGVSYVIWTGSLFIGFAGNDQISLTVRRLRPSGEAIDAAPIVPAYDYRWIQSMATNGRDVFFIVAVSDAASNDVYRLFRITPDGAVIAGDRLPFASPSVAAAGDVVFVTGTRIVDQRDSVSVASYTGDLHARWPAPIALTAGAAAMPAIAADGRNAVVVWSEPGRVAGAERHPRGQCDAVCRRRGPRSRLRLRIASASGAVAVAYERIAGEEPYGGSQRVFVHFFPPPPRRRASVP